MSIPRVLFLIAAILIGVVTVQQAFPLLLVAAFLFVLAHVL